MKYTLLKEDLKENKRDVYLLEGDDAYFRRSGEEQIKGKFLQYPELNFTSFEGESLKGGEIKKLIDALTAFPFMGEYRVVKVTDFYPSESEYNNYLKNLFENFPQSSILIIVNQDGKKSDLKRKRGVLYVDCNQADEETVTRWVYLTLKRANVAAGADVCAAVARYCLCNMSRVAIETEKIIDFKSNDSSPLELNDVDSLVFKDANYKIYEMTDAVSRRDFTKFTDVQRELNKKSGDGTAIISSLFSYFKNLLTIITSEYSDKELSSVLNMKEYGVKKSRERAEAIGIKRLKSLATGCYAAVSDIKRGKISEDSALVNVNNLIFFY